MVLEVGDTLILGPVPADVPLQEPVNHSATAPVPSDPPVTDKVVDAPLQMLVVPVMPVGITEEL